MFINVFFLLAEGISKGQRVKSSSIFTLSLCQLKGLNWLCLDVPLSYGYCNYSLTQVFRPLIKSQLTISPFLGLHQSREFPYCITDLSTEQVYCTVYWSCFCHFCTVIHSNKLHWIFQKKKKSDLSTSVNCVSCDVCAEGLRSVSDGISCFYPPAQWDQCKFTEGLESPFIKLFLLL